MVTLDGGRGEQAVPYGNSTQNASHKIAGVRLLSGFELAVGEKTTSPFDSGPLDGAPSTANP